VKWLSGARIVVVVETGVGELDAELSMRTNPSRERRRRRNSGTYEEYNVERIAKGDPTSGSDNPFLRLKYGSWGRKRDG
jgi:hypothetical protein